LPVDVLVAVLTVVLLGVVVLVVSAPLRAVRRPGVGGDRIDESSADPANPADLADLWVAREAKYREIRDAEMDYRTGKLSDADYAAVDGALRAEAVVILDRLAALGEESGEAAGEPGEGAPTIP
jgi:hypothetical protein